ncbi:hypothetical protein QJS10_CPA16g00022 [Acorus calamus]|uniref:Protein TIC 20 n=1 Tax=Acorus calamus TaxID=4465 RepID=A0AAV9D316_ACOCL|nr:hypothetical protein QJS10_CPA16g00022 [Acorus calamus]
MAGRNSQLVPRASLMSFRFDPYPKMTEKPKWRVQRAPHPIIHGYHRARPELVLHGVLLRGVSVPDKEGELPHFFRFHMLMAMLLDNVLQIICTSCNWFPVFFFKGNRLLIHFWTGVALAYIFTVLECMRCTLNGAYADVPFVADAAYIHTTPFFR